jgi:hypothetical protein
VLSQLSGAQYHFNSESPDFSLSPALPKPFTITFPELVLSLLILLEGKVYADTDREIITRKGTTEKGYGVVILESSYGVFFLILILIFVTS